MTTAKFELRQQFALGGSYSWRLQEGEIRFRGTKQFAGLVDRRIPASIDRVEAFHAALDLLDVWSWRTDYQPSDVGMLTMDGSCWMFTATIGERTCRCGGENAFPSFADPLLTTTEQGRFACLVAAMYACFDIDTYIHIAVHQRKRAEELRQDRSGGERSG